MPMYSYGDFPQRTQILRLHAICLSHIIPFWLMMEQPLSLSIPLMPTHDAHLPAFTAHIFIFAIYLISRIPCLAPHALRIVIFKHLSRYVNHLRMTHANPQRNFSQISNNIIQMNSFNILFNICRLVQMVQFAYFFTFLPAIAHYCISDASLLSKQTPTFS